MKLSFSRGGAAGTLGVLAVLMAGCASAGPPPEIVAKVPADQRQVEIVKTDFSQGQTEATVTFASPSGIFAFNLDLTGLKLSKLTWIIQKQQDCEELTFRPKGAIQGIDLRRGEGVKVSRHNDDLLIQIRSPALGLLKPGGKVQYIKPISVVCRILPGLVMR